MYITIYNTSVNVYVLPKYKYPVYNYYYCCPVKLFYDI